MCFRTVLFSLCLVLFGTISSPLFAGAADGGRGAGVLIGYCDFSRALNEVADGKRAKQRLKIEFQEKQEQLDRLQRELKSSKDAIDRDRLLLSAEALDAREDEYRRKFAELQQRLENFKSQMAARESRLTAEILERLRATVKEIGREEGYALILEKSQDVVLYAPQGNDLTDRVVAAYDKSAGKKK